MAFSTALLLSLATLAAAQAHNVHSVLVFTRHGDRTAKYYKGYQMTNLGAQQVFSSGQYYRQRYLEDGLNQIEGVSTDRVVPSQVWASAPDQYVLYQTATNFLQGLYPPLDGSDLAVETLTNGTDVEDPLNGYQFVLVHGEGESDPDTIWIKGDDACPAYTTSMKSYKKSEEYNATLESSADFYSQFEDVLGPIMGSENVSFSQAYDVFDLLNVASIHNASVEVNPDDLDQLRYYANEWEWHNNYNATQPDRSMGGRTLAGGFLQQLDTVVKSEAKTKFSLMAGSYDTFLAFFGVTNLTAASDDFMGLPNYAASMAFELFTETEEFDEANLMVRFLFRNGTEDDQELTAYPLFGGNDIDIPYSRFVEELSGRAVTTLEQWCSTCGSTEDFCLAPNATASSSSSSSESNSDSKSGSGLSNAAAGGIGAGVTLAVVGLLAAAGWLFTRKRRATPPVSNVEAGRGEKRASDSESA